MAELVVTESDDFKIVIEDKRVGNWSTEVDALIWLIQNYDMRRAEKQVDLDAGYKFYDRVLTAVAAHYAVDVPGAASLTLRELVAGLVEECAALPFTGLKRIVCVRRLRMTGL